LIQELGKGIRLSKKTVSAIMMSLLVLVTLALVFNVQPAKASGTVYIRADGLIDPPTAPIYTADNITYTLTGNITADANGIAIERDNIVLNGAGYAVTGSGMGNGTTLTSISNVTVRNITIKNFTYGIYLYSSSNNTLSDNNVANNEGGIELDSSSNSTLSGNNVANNVYGIGLYSSSGNTLSGNNVTANEEDGFGLDSSSNNTLSGNVLVGNGYSLDVGGSVLSDFLQSVDTSNLADGKPVYYFVNQSDIVINPEAYRDIGYLGFINCANVTVQGLNLTKNGQGLLLAFTNDSKVTGNNVANNYHGIVLFYSSGNTLSGDNVTNNVYGIVLSSSSGNTLSGNNATANNEVGIMLLSSSNSTLSGNNVADNVYGVGFDSSSGNTLSGNSVADNEIGFGLYSSSNNSVFHNSFVNNTIQVYADSSNNTWDDGFPSGGNYWSDYQGTDVSRGFHQNETGSDGIGDTPYVVDGSNRDQFPLMKPYPWAAHDVGVTRVAPSKNLVGQGYSASINIMMLNYGDYTENVNATIHANQTAIGETHNAPLTSGNSLAIRFTWNTTDFSKGNYAISARAEPVQGETDTSDNTLADGLITVTIPGDLDANLQVQHADLLILANAYGSRPGNLKWNPNADINDNGKVDLSDLVLLATHYGQHYP
jgi:parallel beta-helix repeat protein